MIETYSIDFPYDKKRLTFKFDNNISFIVSIRFMDEVRTKEIYHTDFHKILEWFEDEKDTYHHLKMRIYKREKDIELHIDNLMIIIPFDIFEEILKKVFTFIAR